MPNILCIDIETAPNLGFVWGKWQQDVYEYQSEWYVMCYSAKWLRGKQFTKGLPDYKGYSKDRENDKLLVKDLWELLNEADIVIAHNGDQFDIRKMNTRFLQWGMPPPKPYKTIDTKKVARRYFGFNSNKLDDLGASLGLGRKLKHTGFDLWRRCLNADLKAWKVMKAYNKQDVLLLERLYLKMRPWIQNHPNLGMYGDGTKCPKCGGKNLQRRGYFTYKNTTKYQIIWCKSCGGWSRATLNLQETKPLVNI